MQVHLSRVNQATLTAVQSLLSEAVPQLTTDNLLLAIESYNPQASVLDSRPPLTRRECAKMLNLSLPTIDRYLRDGILERIKFGALQSSTIRITASSVERLLNGKLGA